MNTYSKEQLLNLYKQMVLIRRFEERAGQLYTQRLISGFCHLYIGQEAVVTGITACQQANDTVITSYRDHGHMLACGMDPKGVMAELTGRSGGYSKGKGGSMHMFSTEKRFFGGHGIVGAQVPIGTGLAFAHKYKEDNGVCITYLGDGAINQGQVYESFNMAKLWNLPVLYVIEDNMYGMGTSVHRSSANVNFSKRGLAYDIPGEEVNGMDIFEVMEKAKKALNYVRATGPMILHVKTYRYRGHSMSDPGKYRAKEEVDFIKDNQDPIDSFKLKTENILNISHFDHVEEEIKIIVKESVEFAKTSPEPDSAELYTDIFKE